MPVTPMALVCSCCGTGQNQLLDLVFEVGEQDSETDVPLQHTAAPWKYRTRITVDHFFREFQLHVQSSPADAGDLMVLKLFFDEVFNSDVELSVFPISRFISVCHFVDGNICRKFTYCLV